MRFVCVAVLVLVACKIHRLPELPPDRDPVSPDAPVTDYEPPPDVLTKELSTGVADDAADPHAGHHGHHAKEPVATEPDEKEPAAREPAAKEPAADPGGAS
jgi:hypothetical protein